MHTTQNVSYNCFSLELNNMEIHFLGTGAANPSPTRGASSIVIRLPTGSCWMIDCGEGTQTQVMKSNIRPGKLEKIFITHLHGDHVFGLPGLLCTISLNSPLGRSPIMIYGPKGLGQFIKTTLSLSGSQLNFSCVIHELVESKEEIDDCSEINQHEQTILHNEDNQIEIKAIPPNKNNTWNVLDDGNMTVLAAILEHRITCFGYVFQEGEQTGKLNVNLLKSMGIPPGPLYSKLKNGECIITSNGIVVQPRDVLMSPIPGRKVVVLGDTCNSSQLNDIAMNADVLVHEATNENAHQLKCVENGHSTPAMAAKFAKSIRAKN